MKKLLSHGLVVLAGMAGVPAGAASPDVQLTEKKQVQPEEDPRVQSLRRFFQKRQSPAQTLSKVFIEEADKNNLDWRLLPGLALIESGGGNHCKRHNLFGWRNGKASFESFADSVKQVAFHLSNSHYYKHKSLDGMLFAYNRKVGYRERVKNAMYEISPSLEVAL